MKKTRTCLPVRKNCFLIRASDGTKKVGGQASMPKLATPKDDELPLKGIICKKVWDMPPPIVGGPVNSNLCNHDSRNKGTNIATQQRQRNRNKDHEISDMK